MTDPASRRGKLDISEAKLAGIVDLARKADLTPSVDPARKLQAAIERLSEDEQAILLALWRIGKGEHQPSSIDAAIVEAFQARSREFARYIAGLALLGDRLERGAQSCASGPHPAGGARPS